MATNIKDKVIRPPYYNRPTGYKLSVLINDVISNAQECIKSGDIETAQTLLNKAKIAVNEFCPDRMQNSDFSEFLEQRATELGFYRKPGSSK